MVADNILLLSLVTELPAPQEKLGLRGYSHRVLVLQPDRAMKWCSGSSLHRANDTAAFPFRRRSHQTSLCSILSRKSGQSHYPPWQNGESEGDLLPAGLQGRTGY